MWGCFSNLFSSFYLKIIIESADWFSSYIFCSHSQPGVFRGRCSTLGADCPRSCAARLSVRSSVWRWGRRWQTSCLTLSRPSASPRAPTLPRRAVLVSASDNVFLTSNRPATSRGTLTLELSWSVPETTKCSWLKPSSNITWNTDYHVELSWSATATTKCSWLQTVQQHPCSADSTM